MIRKSLNLLSMEDNVKQQEPVEFLLTLPCEEEFPSKFYVKPFKLESNAIVDFTDDTDDEEEFSNSHKNFNNSNLCDSNPPCENFENCEIENQLSFY